MKEANASTMKYQYSPAAYQNRKPRIANNILNRVSFLGAGLGQNIACDVVECKQNVMLLTHISWQSDLHLHRQFLSEAAVTAAEMPLVPA